jgi:hypothetical protein
LIDAIDDVSLPADEEIRSISFIENDNYSGMKQISYPFLDTAEVAYDWSFPYSDDFFRHPSAQFSINMARGSLGMALCAFRSTKNVVPPQYKSYLSGAGFVRVNAFGYDKPTEQDSLSGVIGMKKIDDFMVIAVVTCHRWKVTKKGHGPYSDWYVIVPHLICILIFMLLTQYLTYFMFTIGQARAICAAVTISFIFMLSLRGLIRRKNKRGIITALVTLALVPLSYLYYNKLSIDSFSYVSMAFYFAVILLLTVAAVRTFSDNDPESDSDESGDTDPGAGQEPEASPA